MLAKTRLASEFLVNVFFFSLIWECSDLISSTGACRAAVRGAQTKRRSLSTRSHAIRFWKPIYKESSKRERARMDRGHLDTSQFSARQAR